MTKEYLNTLKEDKGILYIYRIPNSSFADKFEYIIIGNFKDKRSNIRTFTIQE